MTVRLDRVGSRPSHRGLSHLDIRPYLPSILLAGYGVLILSLFFRGVLTWYINPTYVGPATAAAVVLLAVAALGLWRHSAGAHVHAEDACCAGDACDCNPGPRARVYLVLAVPLLLGLLVPPHSLAAFSARQRGPQIAGLSATHRSTTVKRMSLAVDTSSFTLQDWVGALGADPNPADFKGKPIILTGLVIHNPGSVPPGYIMVIRYQVTCCIADARPEGLVVRDTSNGALKDNQWVTVRGTMGSVAFQGQHVAVVEPRRIVNVKAGNPYMY